MTLPTQDCSSQRTAVAKRPGSTSQRFLASRYWLVLKNVLGWPLILASFVAGPLVPGPGGIPLFLIGFALVSFPGKRRLTARVLRGKPVHCRGRTFALLSISVAVVVPAIALAVARGQVSSRESLQVRGPVAVLMLYLLAVVVVWCVVRVAPHVLNLLLTGIARTSKAPPVAASPSHPFVAAPVASSAGA